LHLSVLGHRSARVRDRDIPRDRDKDVRFARRGEGWEALSLRKR